MKKSFNKWSLILLTQIPLVVHAQGWRLQESGVDKILNDVCFVDSLRGWVVGHDGIILHTITGGKTWMVQPGGTNKILSSVTFVDTLRGWAVGNHGLILHTEDGGHFWNAQTSATNLNLSDVYFLNKDHGWAVAGLGTQGILLETRDGGDTWQKTIDWNSGALLSVHFVDDSVGWVVGTDRLLDNFNHPLILHTADGGKTWEEQPVSTTGPLLKVVFRDRFSGWTAGDLLTVLKTTDSGNTWDSINIEPDPGIVALEPIKAISFIDESNIWLARWSKIHHSNDNGATWSSLVPESLADGEQVRGLTFADVNHGWAVGSDGRIWQYDSLVTSIVEPESNEQQPLVFSLYQNYPNPFNPETVIEYQLQGKSSVRLRIYNVTGQEVRTLVDQKKPLGAYRVQWDGRDDEGKVVPVGVYFYRLELGGVARGGRSNFVQTRKMILLK